MLGKGSDLSTIANILDILLTKYEESLDLVSPHSLSLIIKSSINFIELFKLANDEVFEFLLLLQFLNLNFKELH